MQEKLPTLARVVNGWQMNTDTVGVYGNYYLKRALITILGMGAIPHDVPGHSGRPAVLAAERP